MLCMILALACVMGGCSDRGGNASQSPTEKEESKLTDTETNTSGSSTPNTQGEGGAMPSNSDINLLQYQPVKTGDLIAVMTTSMGEIKIRLFPDQAPKTVANFIGLAEEGYYNGKNFHRVINDFMIQGGSLDGSGVGGASIYKDAAGNSTAFEDEFSTDLWNFRGALSMANSGTNTNMSQFFIVQCPTVSEKLIDAMKEAQFPQKVIDKYAENGGTPHLDWRHTVFGHVTEGMDVVDAIAKVDTDGNDHPKEEIIIVSLVIEEAE